MTSAGHLIVVPVHDEAATVGAVIEGARRHGPVLVVDDGSRDGTAGVARAAGAEVLRHYERLGKATALRSGFTLARARGVELVVTLDGDGQHDPADIPALLAAAAEAPGAIILGRRRIDTGALPPERSNAARMAGFFVSWAGGTTLADTQCGFRVYPVALLDGIAARRGGFVFETEILVEAIRAGARVVEIPVRTRPRATARSRFRPLRDGAAITAYLAVPALGRWGTEARVASRAVRALFSAERRRTRHAAMLEAAAPYAGSPAWGAAVGAAFAYRAAARVRDWWRHPARRRAAAAAMGTLTAPGVLALLVLQALAGRRLPDLVTPLVTALYRAERLAPGTADYDVVVIGGGPGGASTATHLARAGVSVAVFEREVFPRVHVGESLMPATMLMLERLGVRERVETSGFQLKYGASFHEPDTGHVQTFYFLPGMPWPNYSYQVPRAEFDTILLDNARKHGVTVFQPETVEDVELDRDGVTLTVSSGDARRPVRARFLVDASGRMSFMAMRAGGREQIPNLGKVALWAHWKGAPRLDGRSEGNIRIYLGEDAWVWWIPLANDLTSIGTVCHARTVRAFDGTPDALYAEMIRRSHEVAEGLAGATRVTEIQREANFAYFNQPVRGDRFLAVGDAIAFVDPIFSGGVFIALWSGEVAAAAIVRAFRAGRFGARRFRAYERRVRTRMAPLFKFIDKYYEPAFMQIFLRPRNVFGVVEGVLAVLSGGSFIRTTWRTRFALTFLFTITRINVWVRRRAGLPVESRLEW